MCVYQKENGKVPCCTHDCEGCVWNEAYEDEKEEDYDQRNKWSTE